MPMTPRELFSAASLTCLGTVRWGERVAVDPEEAGVYVVSLSPGSEENSVLHLVPDFDQEALHSWLDRAKAITLDGHPNPSPEALASRLRKFWMPDESVLYIGKGKKLQRRIGQYYSTKIGKGSPHHGGHWLKTLSLLDDTHVHFAITENDELALSSEKSMLRYFADRVSESTGADLFDPDCPVPFANLDFVSEQGETKRKQHKIGKSSSKSS